MGRQNIKTALTALSGLVAGLGVFGALILIAIGLRLMIVESEGLAGLAAILKGCATAVTACLLAAIGFAIANLLETAELVLKRLAPPPSPQPQQETTPPNDLIFEETDKTGSVRVYKRRIDQESNAFIDTDMPSDDLAAPLKLCRFDEQTSEIDTITTAFKCPWCTQPYEMRPGGNALFKCAKCGNDVLATFS